MAFFQLPDEVRAKIWLTARWRHLAAKGEAMLARKAAALISTPSGLMARLEITPRKLMHIGMERALVEVVEAGLLAERIWNENGLWRTRVWGYRPLDCPQFMHGGLVIGFDYSRKDQWPSGHIGGQVPSWAQDAKLWWSRYNDWLEELGDESCDPPPNYFMPS